MKKVSRKSSEFLSNIKFNKLENVLFKGSKKFYYKKIIHEEPSVYMKELKENISVLNLSKITESVLPSHKSVFQSPIMNSQQSVLGSPSLEKLGASPVGSKLSL